MHVLPEALLPLAAYRQFILYKIVQDKKLPVSPHNFQPFPKGSGWQQDPQQWSDAPSVCRLAEYLGPEYGVGFIFTQNDPFFFLDIDHCLEGGPKWSNLANLLTTYLPGCAIEVSVSGEGLHLFGQGICPPHACRNSDLGIELYTEARFVALTGDRVMGNAAVDCSSYLPGIVSTFFPPKENHGLVSDGPCPEWSGPTDDVELIEKACASKGGSVFSGRACFADLWEVNEEILAANYQSATGDDYDRSSADMALAQHLAFWTGKDAARIERLMWQSGLVREKWDTHGAYIGITVESACRMQKDVYNDGANAREYGAPKLRGSAEQIKYAEGIRAKKLNQTTPEELEKLCQSSRGCGTAKFWIEHKGENPAELVALITLAEDTPTYRIMETKDRSGHQWMNPTRQKEYFKGCCYVSDQHRVMDPNGRLLSKERFNAHYGGWQFQLTPDSSDNPTKSAWEAFTESQALYWPWADKTCFRPSLKPGKLIMEDDTYLVNAYVPVVTPSKPGNVARFLNHLVKILPIKRDQDILIAYMAACVQHIGTKFQWAPLLQGVEGNGKSLFTECVAKAIGERYFHKPPASEIGEKYNSWLFYTLFIGVEDVYVPDQKKEVIEILKPMITSSRLARRAMHTDQQMHDVCCNFIFNSNHKDGIKKTENDRRFCVFYSAQQEKADLARDGMDNAYFKELYDWLKFEDGYAHVTDYLTNYAIPDELNPAETCVRAPETSSTMEAIAVGLGGAEQEVIEAIAEGRLGFAGGWLCMQSLIELLKEIGKEKQFTPVKRAEMLRSMGYVKHPALAKGRVDNSIPLHGNKKPMLFVLRDHMATQIKSRPAVVDAYIRAQEALPPPVNGGEVFRR